ncbi:hypothetical protein KFU94_20855 [Chloroflexi bacterium TSY]|nr:hypothetical protein [Chloroflexi bacterium TSY]
MRLVSAYLNWGCCWQSSFPFSRFSSSHTDWLLGSRASTPGRLRRVLSSALFPTPDQLDPDFRKKASVSHHFPKGVLAHRRLNAAA